MVVWHKKAIKHSRIFRRRHFSGTVSSNIFNSNGKILKHIILLYYLQAQRRTLRQNSEFPMSRKRSNANVLLT